MSVASWRVKIISTFGFTVFFWKRTMFIAPAFFSVRGSFTFFCRAAFGWAAATAPSS